MKLKKILNYLAVWFIFSVGGFIVGGGAVGLMLMIAPAGCEKSYTGTGETQYRLDPNAVAVAEKGAEVTIGTLTTLAALWPELLGIAGTLAGALGVWRLKIKPKLMDARSESEMWQSVAYSLVQAIDVYKTAYPQDWND